MERERALADIMAKNGGIPPLDVAEQIEKESAPKLSQLASEFKKGIKAKPFAIGQSFSSLPSISEFPINTEITDEETGVVYRNNGKEWIRI